MQAVAKESITLRTRKERALEHRPRTTRAETTIVNRTLWETVKTCIREGEQIVIVSEHEVWLVPQ